MAEGTVLVPNTAGGFPVDGVGVTAAAALTAGQAIRQIAAIGDATVAANIAKVNATGDQLTSSIGIGGSLVAMVTPSTNGTVLTSGTTGLSVHLPPGASYTYTLASTAPGAAPTLLITTSNPSTATSTLIDQINLAAGTLAYVTATTAGATATSYRSY